MNIQFRNRDKFPFKAVTISTKKRQYHFEWGYCFISPKINGIYRYEKALCKNIWINH